MKPIRVTKNFEKSYKKRIGLSIKLRSQYVNRVELFKTGKRDCPVDDHSLAGKLKGKRAFSIANDIRVIYEETEDEIVFIDIGSHNQVY